MVGLIEEDFWKFYGKDVKYDIKKIWEYGVIIWEFCYEELFFFKKLMEEISVWCNFEDKDLVYY